jgi:hypothetical protein
MTAGGSSWARLGKLAARASRHRKSIGFRRLSFLERDWRETGSDGYRKLAKADPSSDNVTIKVYNLVAGNVDV